MIALTAKQDDKSKVTIQKQDSKLHAKYKQSQRNDLVRFVVSSISVLLILITLFVFISSLFDCEYAIRARIKNLKLREMILAVKLESDLKSVDANGKGTLLCSEESSKDENNGIEDKRFRVHTKNASESKNSSSSKTLAVSSLNEIDKLKLSTKEFLKRFFRMINDLGCEKEHSKGFNVNVDELNSFTQTSESKSTIRKQSNDIKANKDSFKASNFIGGQDRDIFSNWLLIIPAYENQRNEELSNGFQNSMPSLEINVKDHIGSIRSSNAPANDQSEIIKFSIEHPVAGVEALINDFPMTDFGKKFLLLLENPHKLNGSSLDFAASKSGPDLGLKNSAAVEESELLDSSSDKLGISSFIKVHETKTLIDELLTPDPFETALHSMVNHRKSGDVINLQHDILKGGLDSEIDDAQAAEEIEVFISASDVPKLSSVIEVEEMKMLMDDFSILDFIEKYMTRKNDHKFNLQFEGLKSGDSFGTDSETELQEADSFIYSTQNSEYFDPNLTNGENQGGTLTMNFIEDNVANEKSEVDENHTVGTKLNTIRMASSDVAVNSGVSFVSELTHD